VRRIWRGFASAGFGVSWRFLKSVGLTVYKRNRRRQMRNELNGNRPVSLAAYLHDNAPFFANLSPYLLMLSRTLLCLAVFSASTPLLADTVWLKNGDN
jgi:hypothetical protein